MQARGIRRSDRLFHVAGSSGSRPGGLGGQAVIAGGGPVARVCTVSQLPAQGHAAGRCRIGSGAARWTRPLRGC